MSGWGGVGEALMNLGGQYMDSYNRKKQYEFESEEEEKKWKLREQIRVDNEKEIARVKAMYEQQTEEAKRNTPEYKAEQQRKKEKHESDMQTAATTRALREAQAERARRQPVPRASTRSQDKEEKDKNKFGEFLSTLGIDPTVASYLDR